MRIVVWRNSQGVMTLLDNGISLEKLYVFARDGSRVIELYEIDVKESTESLP